MAHRSEWIYDELLSYVGSPLFQAPVLTFMEANCLIFDPALEDCKEYRELHGAYCALVTTLLNAFRQDTDLTHEQVIKAMTEMSRRSELREVFSGLFELILATESFRLFSRLMTQKNLELQQQALMLIMKQYGHVPEILQSTKPSESQEAQAKQAQPQASQAGDAKHTVPSVKQQEAEIMESIMRSAVPSQPGKGEVDEGMKKVAVAEAGLIKFETQVEQQKLEKVMKELSVEEKPTVTSTSSMAETAVVKPALPRLTSHAPPPAQSHKEPVKASKPVAAAPTGNAAAQWIAQAKAENNQETVSAVETAADTLAKMSPDELKKRQEYLKEQREKLTAMKQKEREKQLDSYEKSTSARPKSARVARSVLSRAPAPTPTNEDDDGKKKEMDMRRAIANRLKAEVLETQQF
ncbi:cilia- and flagella-associated protein 36-like [Watersipora subatra]|uniref:cilia- and flagella-associated protein 36-like n=1 Tax=Watersipora subatra TaxID=2589382 RepID=UPI00355B2B86